MTGRNTTSTESDTNSFNISLCDILEYFGDAKRPIRAGEDIVKAGWIYALGTAPPPNTEQVIGLVIQTSAMTNHPHEVKLLNLAESRTNWKCMCTCKAGAGEKCKHIAACLLKIYREPQLESVSCTELKQKWGKSAKYVSSKYSAVTVQNMCHVIHKQKIRQLKTPTVEAKKRVLSILINGASHSELLKTKSYNRSLFTGHPSETIASDEDDFFKLIISHDGLQKFVPLKNTYINANTPVQYQDKVVKTIKQAIDICKSTCSQTSAQWRVERKNRITASVSYNLYTYVHNKNPNWTKKLQSVYDGNFAGNDATRYGQQSEKRAKQRFRQIYLLFEVGLVISRDLPFLAASPDGIFYNGDEWKLLEIKCPVKGKFLTAVALLATLPYLYQNKHNEYKLNQKHLRNYIGSKE